MKLIIIFVLLATALAVDLTHSSSRRHKSKWFFNSIFKWETASLKITSGSKDYSFSGKINSNERGIYFKEITDGTGSLKFFEEITYKHNIEGVDATVLDFQLMPSCKFSREDDSMFSGFKFGFDMRNFQKESYKQINYKVLVSFKWGSKVLGSVDVEKIISQLQANCRTRQVEIEKQRIEAMRVEEKLRIEAQRLKLEQEQKLAEEKKKKEEEEKRLEEEKKIEEQKAKLAAAEKAKKEAEKKAEEARQRKIEEEQKAADERKKKEEEARKEEQVKKEEEERKIQEQKSKIEAEEKARREAEKKAEEEKLKKIQEEIKVQEEKRRKEEEARKAEEEKKAEEERKKLEEKVKLAAEEKAKKEAERKEEEEKLKKLQEEMKAKDEKRKKEEEERKAEEAKKLEEAAKEEEKKKKQAKEEQDKKDEEAKFDKNEKKNIEVANTIRVNFNTGYGRALYITGEDSSLGNWSTAYKLKVMKADEWQYASPKLVDGMEFKTIVYNWVNEDTIDLKAIPARNLRWEDKPGKEGNKITRFVENMMDHKPSFAQRRRRIIRNN